MKSPLDSGPWLELEEVESTQAAAAALLRDPKEDAPGVVFARNQTGGKGRFGRTWLSEEGDSLTMSLVFGAYADHPKPWLIGMAAGMAAAGALHCLLRWPNDLIIEGRKLGGILTELITDSHGRKVPVVGIGVNLGQVKFAPEIEATATSLAVHRRGPFDPVAVAQKIIGRLADLPEPDSWKSLVSVWELFDDTPGKLYKLPDGQQAVAMKVGPEGELLCSVEGESVTVMAAEALFGPGH
jgi:BirA family transcriptional regulator, biotin operon repressor / biotin---[acetyl-CoA-carboxylase] ligase